MRSSMAALTVSDVRVRSSTIKAAAALAQASIAKRARRVGKPSARERFGSMDAVTAPALMPIKPSEIARKAKWYQRSTEKRRVSVSSVRRLAQVIRKTPMTRRFKGSRDDKGTAFIGLSRLGVGPGRYRRIDR